MKNKKVKVYEELRKKIIAGELAPGLPINEANFAAELGVSKTPIREALRQLEMDGLVENVPGRGSTITHITSREIRDVFEIREIIETGAVKLIARTGGNEELRRERENCRQALDGNIMEKEYVSEFGSWEDMHLTIVQSLGNETLMNMYSGVLDRIIRIRNYYGKSFTNRRYHDIIREHADILDAIEAGNEVDAEEKLRFHLQNARKFIAGLTANLTS